MRRNFFVKVISLFLTATTFLFLFYKVAPSYVYADTTDNIENEEEIDPKHMQFVVRLYAVVTRQMHADEEEKIRLAQSLDEGISAAYSVMFRFYFSDEYKELGQSDEQFVEDLYTGTRGRYVDEESREYFVARLEDGYSRYIVFQEVIASNEFVRLCREYNIDVEQDIITDYEDHEDGMICISDNYYDLDSDGDLVYCYAGAGKHARCINEEFYSSPTDYYIIADIDNCYIMIFEGSICQWSLCKIYPMSCGKEGHETPRGDYEVTGKRYSIHYYVITC